MSAVDHYRAHDASDGGELTTAQDLAFHGETASLVVVVRIFGTGTDQVNEGSRCVWLWLYRVFSRSSSAVTRSSTALSC